MKNHSSPFFLAGLASVMLVTASILPSARSQTATATLTPISTWPTFIAALSNASTALAAYKTNSVSMTTYAAATNQITALSTQNSNQQATIASLQGQVAELTAQQQAALSLGNQLNSNLPTPTQGP